MTAEEMLAETATTTPSADARAASPPNAASARGASSRRWVLAGLVVMLVVIATVGASLLALPRSSPTSSYVPQVRNYYVASNEVEWNYTPDGMDLVALPPIPLADSPLTSLYTARNATYLGTSFLKCVYQQYTDGSFGQLVPRPADQAYLGLLGPVLYAAVGDTLHVHYRNNCRFTESMHPQGLYYSPNSSGTPYNGSASLSEGGSVPDGGEFNYTWSVPASAGPGTMDGESVLWAYFSGASLLNSSDTGLMGPILVTADAHAAADGEPYDVQDTVILCLSTINEGNSPYLAFNVQQNARDPAKVNPNDPTWIESLNKNAVNGFLYGNMPVPTIYTGRETHWYVMALGNFFHPVEWQGNPVEWEGLDVATVPLYPGSTAEVQMNATSVGTWVVGSGEENDIAGGMQALYQVVAPTTSDSSVAAGPSVEPEPGRAS